MSAATTQPSGAKPSETGMSTGTRRVIAAVAVIVLLVAMGLDTTVVKIGADVGSTAEQFSPEQYGKTEFPKVQKAIEQRAAPADQLAKALKEGKSAAGKKFGVPGAIGPIMSVKFTGTVGEGDSGIYNVKVPGLPDDVAVRVQTGPAINGTELRDGAGSIAFGDFKNQIEYQNAAAAINDQMKKELLSDLDRDSLTGKKISVTGAFQLINPKNWLVTPVRLSVQP